MQLNPAVLAAFTFAVLFLRILSADAAEGGGPTRSLRLVTPNAYLAGLPVVVRVEAVGDHLIGGSLPHIPDL